ncbi:uncharacterized protein KY384_006249 [Bacidia gigantensis]|uniref:uncharacterized protein n=1 Tax=Bacidia gigantensis TaxID=2732470 RepID=UPI001D048003|nr:uncharacterized protein KY384_006249 [Bacidia gigantensis]KAG8529612.1 hypothetical protein KY384_006249 [Bacidia gigantensis]
MTMAQALDPLHLLYPADYDTRVQHILCYMREDPYSKNFKESERQYFPVKFPDGTEVKHPPLIIAPGHACTLWGQLHHRDYDNLQITFGNIFIDVPTEIRRYEDMKGRMGASEVDAMKAGRCRLPEKDVGPRKVYASAIVAAKGPVHDIMRSGYMSEADPDLQFAIIFAPPHKDFMGQFFDIGISDLRIVHIKNDHEMLVISGLRADEMLACFAGAVAILREELVRNLEIERTDTRSDSDKDSFWCGGNFSHDAHIICKSKVLKICTLGKTVSSKCAGYRDKESLVLGLA